MSTDIDVLKLENRPFVKRSFTTAAGNVAGTTLVDAGLTEPNDYWNGMCILIRTAGATVDCSGQLRRVLDWDLATNTLTVNVPFTDPLHPADPKIEAGVQYVMMCPAILNVAIAPGGGFKSDLQQVLGQGADISPDNPLQTEDAAISPARGTTTANGLPGGTTVVDTTRTEPNDHWNTMALLITSGAQAGQVREITDWVVGTGTFTIAPAFGGQILTDVTYKILSHLPADIDIAAIEAKLGEIADAEAEAGAALPRLLWIKNGVRRGTGTILPVNSSLYDWILTRAVAGDAMALTAAERLVVQALILSDATPFPGADIPLIRAETDQLPNVEHETEWAAECVCDEVESADAANLTAGSITPTFPAGSTRVRAILVASIHIVNLTAATHHINFKVQGQKAAGGYVDQLDLSASAQLGMVNLDGATDAWCGAIDVTTLVDTSGAVYDFRFVVDSDNAGMVRYITCFTLVLVYTM